MDCLAVNPSNHRGVGFGSAPFFVLPSRSWPRKSQRNEAYPERAPAHPQSRWGFLFLNDF